MVVAAAAELCLLRIPARVFKSGEIMPDVLLASAFPPFLFQAVTIDGEPYWDAG